MKLITFLMATIFVVGSAFAADAPQAADAKPVAVRAAVTPGSVKAEVGSAARHGKLKKARHSKKTGGAITAAVK